MKRDYGPRPPLFVGLMVAVPLGILLWVCFATLIQGMVR